MRESQIDIVTRDGTMQTRMFDPEQGERAPLVVFYMDAFGVRESLAGMARRIAAAGYVVALPNLFYRVGPVAPFDVATAFSVPAERDRIMGLMRGLTPAGVASDTAAVFAHVESAPGANASLVCTVGYCMGGGYALRAAGTFPARVVAAASYHGGHLATDAADSPHVIAARARGRLYIGYAEHDHSFPDAQRRRLEDALNAAHVTYAIEAYHAAHGFAVPDHAVYDERAAARHWETLLALFADATGRTSAGR
jgi:carboxymethylenebutenolidase